MILFSLFSVAIPKSNLFFAPPTNLHHPLPHKNRHKHVLVSVPGNSHWATPIKTSYHHSSPSPRPKQQSVAPAKAKDSKSSEEDGQALETVLRLYTAIKNRDIHELSQVIGDECHCFSNFISFFGPFVGKNQVLGFFTYLIRTLGNNIEFVVKPTLHNGMSVGVQWKLECNKTHVPLGKGFSFHICQSYQGKVVIRNVEMFMEPLLHIEPIRLKMTQHLMTLLSKIYSYSGSKDKAKRAAFILVSLFLMAGFLVFIKRNILY